MRRSRTTGRDPLSVTPDTEAEGVFLVHGRVTLFGFDSSEAIAHVRPRARRWRVGGAARTGLLFLLVAPVVGIVPPHAPWILGALGVGGFLARRRWNHHFTLEGVDATCPKCGAALGVRPAQLSTPHTIPCDTCHHEPALRVLENDLADLEGLTG